MVTAVVYDDRYRNHKTGSHVESPARIESIWAAIQENKLLDRDQYRLVKPEPASIEDVSLIHETSMINRARVKAEQAKNGSLQVLDFGDTVVSEDSYNVALLAAGGLLAASEEVLSGAVKNAFAIVRPPGHHANRQRSSGFCIFNNVAILAEHLIKRKGLKRVAIFDIDLHHGNGTAEIFYERNNVLFFSSHQDGRTMYPGSGFVHEIGEGNGKGYTINIPLAPDATDDIAAGIVDRIVAPVFEQFQPEIILGSIGCDAHFSDPLSGLQFTSQGYGNLVKYFKAIADKTCDGKMILTLEGGYKVKILAQSVINVLNVLAGEKMTYHDREITTSQNLRTYHDILVDKLREVLGPYWKL